MDSNKIDKRDEIIQQAYRVFYKEGFHSAGVDLVLKNTGISKRTLYKYFQSKEDLAQAVIEYYSRVSYQALDHFLGKYTSPTQKILGIFDWLKELVDKKHLSGCMAINAKLEYSQKNSSIEAQSCLHFQAGESMFRTFCEEANLKEPRNTAKQIQIIYLGAVIACQADGTSDAAVAAKSVAKIVINASL
jgi:AcrR family transcriptional regulator